MRRWLRTSRAWFAGLGILALTTACSAAQSAAPAASSAPAAPVTATPTIPSAGTASTTVPSPDHVVVVVLENKDVGQVLGNSRAPFLNQLAHTGVSFTNAHAETHPSQPNYLALFTGTTHGVTDDSCLPALTGPNLATQLQTTGHSFIGYSESLPRPGSPAVAAASTRRSTHRGPRSVTWHRAPTSPGARGQPRSTTYRQSPSSPPTCVTTCTTALSM